MYSVADYGSMIADAVRMRAYEEALRRTLAAPSLHARSAKSRCRFPRRFAEELPARVLRRVGKGEFARHTAGDVPGHPATNLLVPGLQALGLVDGAAFRRAWEHAADARALDGLAPLLAIDAFVRWHQADAMP